MTTLRFRLYEIEHEEDLDNATGILTSSGASVVEVLEFSETEESALFEVTVTNAEEFRRRVVESEELCY